MLNYTFSLVDFEILILILVGGTYFIAQEYSAGIENAVNTSAGGQSLTKETITNLGDVLATVEAEIAGGAGSEKTNDTVKSDYQPVRHPSPQPPLR